MAYLEWYTNVLGRESLKMKLRIYMHAFTQTMYAILVCSDFGYFKANTEQGG